MQALISRGRASLAAATLCALGLLVGGCVAVGLATDATTTSRASTHRDRSRTYVGHLAGTAAGHIRLRVAGSGANMTVEGKVERAPDLCEDGKGTSSNPWAAQPVGRHGHFRSIAATGPATSVEPLELGVLEGRVAANEISGYLLNYFNPADGLAGANLDECWSGKVRWTAHRLRSSHRAPAAALKRSGATAQRAPRLAPGHGHGSRYRVRMTDDGSGVIFSADIRQFCDFGDAPRRAKVGPVRLKLDRHGNFTTVRFRQSKSKDRSLLLVEGKLHPSGTASGLLIDLRDPWDPDGTTNEPECGTPPLASWRVPVQR